MIAFKDGATATSYLKRRSSFTPTHFGLWQSISPCLTDDLLAVWPLLAAHNRFATQPHKLIFSNKVMMPRAFELAVCALASVGLCVDAAVWRMPLGCHLVNEGESNTQAAHRALQSLPFSGPSSTRHASVWTPSFPSSSKVTDDVPFVNTHDHGPRGNEIFAGEILIGTPPQAVSLAIDVVSGDVIVLNHKLQDHAYYDHSASTTYVANGTRVSFVGTDGFVSRDHVGVGFMQVKSQFLTELAGPDEMLVSFPVNFDGEIGLGPTSALTRGETPPLVRSMITQNLLDRPVVGLHLGDQDAHVLFGGIDAKYSDDDIMYFPHDYQAPYGWWARVDSVSVDSEPLTNATTSSPAVIVLTSLMGAPKDQALALAKTVGSTNQQIPCEDPGPDITLHLGRLNVTLTKKDYTVPLASGICMFAIIQMPQETGWILGLPFLRRVYTVLDFSTEGDERLGFANVRVAT